MNVLEGDTVAQLAHVGWGAALVFTLDRWLEVWAAIVVVAVLSFVKEALEAQGWAFWEAQQGWSSSLRDFEFFLIGIAWAAGVLML